MEIVAFILVLFSIAFYFLPFLTAWGYRHRNRKAILVLNLFLGWTLLGWVLALVWAFTSNCEPTPEQKADMTNVTTLHADPDEA